MSAGKVEGAACATCWACGPRPYLRSPREAAGRCHRRGARHVRPPAPRRCRAGPGPYRFGRGRAFDDSRQNAGRDRRRRGLPAEERRRAAALAERLSVAILARAWQMLLKGLEEIAGAPNPAAAAEMVLIRLAFTADLPAPADIIDALGGVQRAGSRPAATDKAEKRPAVGTPVDLLEPPAERRPFQRRCGPHEPRNSRPANPTLLRRCGRRCRRAARGQAQSAPGRACEPGTFRSGRQHRVTPPGRCTQ